MLNLKRLYQQWKLSQEVKTHEKRLKLLFNRLKVIDKSLAVIAHKEYITQAKKLDNVRIQYIKFLKDNNLWTKQMEEHYNIKKLKHPLRMKVFSEDYIKRMAKQRFNIKYGNKNTKKKREFGDNEYDNYLYYQEVINLTTEVCMINNWLTRKDWKERQVPMNRMIKEFFDATVKYSEIKKYYAKQFFDQRTRMHTK